MGRAAALLGGLCLAACSGTPEVSDLPVPGGSPARYFNLSHWSLVLPGESAIAPEFLRSGFQRPPLFYLDAANKGLVMRCTNAAIPNVSSAGGPIELLETRDPGGSNPRSAANTWSPEEGGTLHLSLRVDAMPVGGSERDRDALIIASIRRFDQVIAELIFQKHAPEQRGRLFVRVHHLDAAPSDVVMIDNDESGGLALGAVFSAELQMRGPELKVKIATQTGALPVADIPLGNDYASWSLSFDAGVHPLAPSSSPDCAQITVFALSATHP
jgi:hypothetical protein